MAYKGNGMMENWEISFKLWYVSCGLSLGFKILGELRALYGLKSK
jgi:hypothetical protein